jgi:hypothetical protein
MTLRQDVLPEPPGAWLTARFGPRSLPATTGALAAAKIRHEGTQGNGRARLTAVA